MNQPLKSLFQLCALLTFALAVIGVGLHWRWSDHAGASLLLGMAIAAIMLCTLHPNLRTRLHRLAALITKNPWPWLLLALVLTGYALFFGHSALGARRYFGGEWLHLRSGLWAGAAFLVFISRFGQLEKPTVWRHAAGIVGSGLLAFMLLMQPDFAALGLIAAASLLAAFRARNALRWWLPAGALATAGTGAFLLLQSPYRLERLLQAASAATEDPLSLGFQANVQARAQEFAGMFGGGGDTAARELARLPVDAVQHAPAYLLHAGGWVSYGLVILMLITLTVGLWRMAKACTPATRPIIEGSALILLLSSGWSLTVHLAHWSISAAPGLPFVGSLELGFLLALAVAAAGMTIDPTAIKNAGGAAAPGKRSPPPSS